MCDKKIVLCFDFRCVKCNAMIFVDKFSVIKENHIFQMKRKYSNFKTICGSNVTYLCLVYFK